MKSNCHFLRPPSIGSILALLVSIGAGLLFVPTSFAATKYWVAGTGDGGNWSNPGSWNPAGVPQNGDDLIFRATAEEPSPVKMMHNDLVGLQIRQLIYCDNGWSLDGNELTLLDRIQGFITPVCNGSMALLCPLKLGGRATFNSGYSLILRGNIDLNGNDLFLVSGQHQMIVSSQITGTGNIIATVYSYVDGDARIVFDGPTGNTFSGKLTVRREYLCCEGETGEVIFDKQSGVVVNDALLIGDLTLANAEFAVCRLARSHQIGDAAEVCLTGGGRLLLDDHNETIGSLCLTNSSSDMTSPVVYTGDGILSVQRDIIAVDNAAVGFALITGKPGAVPGKLDLPPGNHLIQVSGLSGQNGLRIEADILGGGGFTKTGPGRLVLFGNSTFDGDVVLREGVTLVQHDHALGDPSGAVILDGGDLHLQDVAVSLKTLWVNQPSLSTPNFGGNLIVSGVSSWPGPVVLNTNLAVNGTSMAFSGAVSGPGSLYLFNGTTHIQGSEANTYQGTTYAYGNLLELNKPASVRAISGTLRVGGGNVGGEVRWQQDFQSIGADVTLFPDALINLNGHRDEFGPVTFNGGTISTGAGEIGIYGLVIVNASGSEASISGRLGLPPGPHEFHVLDGAPFPDLRIDATVIGPGSLRKTGLGQMWLSASNSYEGLTTVAEGALSVLNPFGLGAISSPTTVDDGATLELNFTGAPMSEPLAIRGTGLNGNGALGGFGDVTLRPTLPSISAAIDLTTNTTIAVAPGARLTVDGFISGIGPLTKTGRGTLVLANSNPNTYSGDTIVADGVLNLSKPNSAIAVPGDLFVGPAPLNSLAIARWSTPNGMNPLSIAHIHASSLLDLNGNDQTIYRLYLGDGGDVQTGAGKLTFQGGAIVNVGSQNPLGSHDGSTISGNIGLAPNSTLIFEVSPFAPTPPFYFGPELDVNAAIPAPADNLLRERAGLSKFGTGRMRLSGNNSFRGWVNIGEGALTAASSTALGALFFQSGTYVFDSGTLQLEGGVNIEGEHLVLNSTATPALESLFGESYWSGQVTLSRDSSIGADPNSVLQLAGVIAGTGNLAKLGVGTLRFGGGNANTYSGDTSVHEGTLLMSKPDGVTAVPGSLSIGAPAGLPAAAVNLTSYQVLGNIFVNRGGLLNLNGQAENVDHLWLMEGGDVQTATGVLAIKTGGSIQVFPGAINDPATISGAMEFLAGTHAINVAGSTSSTGGPDLDITAMVTSSGATVTLEKMNSGKLRLGANNDYVGSTVVNSGILQVDGSQPSSGIVVHGGARLAGTGHVGPVTFTAPSGVVAPGNSTANFDTGDFNLDGIGGILQFELNGATAGSGYDRLTIHGSAALTAMTLQASVNFAAATNDQFTIIANDLADAITGTFSGLPEGASVTFGDQIFRITYVGGDGNDVVLTKTGDVYRPRLTIERIAPSSVRLLWPTSAPPFNLQSSTNLNTNVWTAVTPPPAIMGTNNIVTNSATNGFKFYRLFKP